MTVLHLISSGGMYGAEAVILALSHALNQGGDTSVIASFSNASQQLHERAVAEGLTSILIPCQGQFSPVTLRAIRDTVTRHGIDLVHAHGYKADLYGWAALRGSGIPLVSTCHTWYDNDLTVRVYGALDRRVLRTYARVVAVSAEVESRLLHSGVHASRIRRIRNGIDLQPFRSIAERRGVSSSPCLTVGLVGRLAREKGVDLFLEAAAVAAAALPDVQFVVVGEGPERGALQQRIQTSALGDRVQLLGHQTTMPPLYAGMDLLVSASRQEGLPIALLEGMASGLPVVATAVGEVPSLVLPGQTGVLVSPEDVPAIAAAMTEVLLDSSRRLSLGQNAHRLVEEQFSVGRMAAEYQDVYREAALAAGRRP